MNIAILTISGLSLVVSATTLALLIVGGLKAKNEVTEVRDKANNSIAAIKLALDKIEI